MTNYTTTKTVKYQTKDRRESSTSAVGTIIKKKYLHFCVYVY